MSGRVTVLLPDDPLAFIDGQVEQGLAPNRASVVERSVHRDHRRTTASRDAAALAGREDRDLGHLAAYARTIPLDIA
jgi:Arc/MetJ-type ribon-helix-helix transcriptional regulator